MISNKALNLHVADHNSIPGTPYGLNIHSLHPNKYNQNSLQKKKKIISCRATLQIFFKAGNFKIKEKREDNENTECRQNQTPAFIKYMTYQQKQTERIKEK